VIEFFELFSAAELGIPMGVAVLAIIGLVYVYRDAKIERKERQNVMDRQNSQWLNLYAENIEEIKKMREESANTRQVIGELKGLIKIMYEVFKERT